MKSRICGFIASVIAVIALGGCGTIQQQSAMQWMQSQPMLTDP
jgi:hypothetical protein